MKFLKSLLTGTGAVVLAGLVLALLAPKAVHAVVATAVQVVNTSANPAITEDTSRQASQIVTVQCTVGTSFNNDTFCFQVLPNGGFSDMSGPRGGYVVPANQYFVLKSVDTNVVIPSFAPTLLILLSTPQGMETTAETLPLISNGQISLASGIVAGPGMEVIPTGASFAVDGSVTLHGYLTPN